MENKKILIIEDNRDMAKLISVALRAEGFESSVSFDGMDGIRSSHSAKPDLIILDLMLPAGGGLWVLDNLRASSGTWDIPVVVYTAAKDDERRKQALAKGADAYFEKTGDLSALVDTVKKLLSCKGGEKS